MRTGGGEGAGHVCPAASPPDVRQPEGAAGMGASFVVAEGVALEAAGTALELV